VVSIGAAIKDLMKTYVQYPPRKQPSASYSGPITLQQYERCQFMRDALAKEGINIRYRPVINLGAGAINDRLSQGGPHETAIPDGDITPRGLGLRPTIPATCRRWASHNAG
jgi:hypothetical protein